ncbi:MAG: hypothetical protein P4L74_03195 [Candidatus Doudnabacteria bacterium]|nr:hypothetical protein [Candidatus Doudnabacteria bacterium]
MKKILFWLIVIMLVTPVFSFADSGDGGGGNPPQPFEGNCGFNYWLSNDDNIFQDFHSQEYVNGLLEIHLMFNSTTEGYNNINHYLVLYDSDCNKYFYYADFAQDPSLNIPPNTSGVSLRFTSPTHFQVWDDDLNQRLDCDQCDVDLSSYGFPSGLRASFHLQLNDYDNNKYDWDFSEGFPVQEPVTDQKTPVLIVPGILGTKIVKQSEVLWPDVVRMAAPLGDDSFMDPLILNPDGSPLDTSVAMPDILREPYPGEHFYDGIIQSFIDQGYVENKDLFVFPYDWRQDIFKTAYNEEEQGLSLDKRTDLAGKIDQILSNTGADKVDIIAHSQGGLVTKRLLFEKPSYQDKIRKLVLVGVPNFGSPQTAKTLLYGDNMGIIFKKNGINLGQLNPEELKKMGLNMPSAYELLPSPSYFLHEPLGYIYDYYQFYLNTYQKSANYLKQNNLNGLLIDNATIFHDYNYDNFDFSKTGIETFNIVGCEQGTLGTLVTKANADQPGLWFTAGDGTVPFNSANQAKGATSYYIRGAVEHSKMLSDASIMPLATDLITGVILPAPANVVTDSSQCHFDGTEVSVHSPVDLDIYDEHNNHVGVSNNDNSPFVDLGVPGAQYEEIGHNKFAFLPAGHTYKVQLNATGAGSFSLDSSQIQNGGVVGTTHYDSVNITASSKAEVDLTSGNNQPIKLDLNGDGTVDQTIQPSSVLNADQSQDLVPPVSTSTIAGIMGQEGFYRSNATVTLVAIDPLLAGQESQTSGILNIRYSLDNSATTTYQSPVIVTAEGPHSISFFATDKAGNNEPAQTVSFTVDKTAPEAVIQFSPSLKDIQFTGSDNISTTSKVAVLDKVNDILLTDQAGNVTEIKLKEKNRKASMQSTIQSLSYNGTAQDVSKNTLAFVWQYDKKNNLTKLTQNVAAKKTYYILAVYNGKKTTLAGLDKSGIILKSIPGLSLLKVTTNKGDLGWSI